MTNISKKEIIKLSGFAILINLIFTLFLFSWVTDDDITGLPKNKTERFISLFYYGVTTFTTTGYGDICAKSSRMKLVISFYMILIFSGITSLLVDL